MTALDEFKAEAYSRGVDAAKAAATWIADGNSDPQAISETLAGLEIGDPEVIDRVWEGAPNLSGEWADDPTPQSLTCEIVGDFYTTGRAYENLDDILADEFERGVSETFQEACEKELRKWLA